MIVVVRVVTFVFGTIRIYNNEIVHHLDVLWVLSNVKLLVITGVEGLGNIIIIRIWVVSFVILLVRLSLSKLLVKILHLKLRLLIEVLRIEHLILVLLVVTVWYKSILVLNELVIHFLESILEVLVTLVIIIFIIKLVVILLIVFFIIIILLIIRLF